MNHPRKTTIGSSNLPCVYPRDLGGPRFSAESSTHPLRKLVPGPVFVAGAAEINKNSSQMTQAASAAEVRRRNSRTADCAAGSAAAANANSPAPGADLSAPPPAAGGKSPPLAAKFPTRAERLKSRRIPRDEYFPFVELLARSNFSFLQGASHPEEMALQAQALGYKGIAICDLNGLYGVVRGFQAIEYPSNFLIHDENLNKNFHFHCGAEMQLADGTSVALLPMNKEGYSELCQIITESKRQSEKGFSNLDLSLLAAHADDLIAFALPPWSPDKLEKLREIYHGRLYLPVWKDYTWHSLDLYNQALALEQQHGFELFATQRPLMHSHERKPVLDVLTCILHKCTLKEAKVRLTANGERHLKPLHELKRLWADRPDLLLKTTKIAAHLQFSLKELRYEYPEAARPPGKDAAVYLRELTEAGLKRRFPDGVDTKVRGMVEHELALIAELRYEDYFLTLWDVCQFAVRQGILHQGRGSAANSVVCYALGLTAVDPTKVQLLFERFISRERGEPPDIDIDFESGRREEVIQYIYEKYGARHAAMVCNVICYRSRLAIRETAKVLGIQPKTLDEMVKYMGRDGVTGLEAAPEKAKDWNIEPRTFSLLLQITRAISGFPRHLGIHPGGFLIAKRPITECVPVEKATMDGRYVIQWNKDDINVLKMLKIDVLGLGMLTALEKCFALLRRHKNIEHDLYNIPAGDKPTYDMISKADTVGTFQIESRAQMGLLPRLKPKCFYDLVIEVAIVRPGPIQGGMIHPFIRRRDGKEKITYPHPDLIPILSKTCGVPIFQEQIMQIASTVGGFTPGEADELRRIMSSSWKKADLMQGLRTRLINGMLNHGISLQYAEQIYQTIVGFASYGFPESHAASFALITYTSCYLKCHHPEIFVTGLLNAQPMGFYSPRALIMDAQRHGVKFRPVDVQKSDYDYTLEQGEVRVGLRAVYGLKEKHTEQLLNERARGGPFRDLSELIQRTRLPKATLVRLAAAGAFRCLNLDAREALWRIQGIDLDVESLFFAQTEECDRDLVPRENDWEKLNREYQTHGYSLVHHPLGILRPALERWSVMERRRNLPGFTKAVHLPKLNNGARVRVAGLLSLQQRPPTAKGFAFLTLEDEGGLINVVLMPEIYKKFRLVIVYNPLLDISGTLEKAGGVINLKAREIRPLPVDKLLGQLPKALPGSGTDYDFKKCIDDHTVG